MWVRFAVTERDRSQVRAMGMGGDGTGLLSATGVLTTQPGAFRKEKSDWLKGQAVWGHWRPALCTVGGHQLAVS